MKKDLSEELARLQDICIESLGNLTYSHGDRRLTGRVIGLLFIDNSIMSLTEIAARLRVSKPAVSNVIHIVERKGLVERLYNPDKPHSAFFRLRERHWEFATEQIERTIQGLMDLADTIVGELENLRREFGSLPEEFDRLGEKATQLINVHTNMGEFLRQFKEIISHGLSTPDTGSS